MNTSELAGTKSLQNLLFALSNESKAQNNYLYYAQKAREEGYAQAATLFEQMADNEKEHSRLWFRYIHDEKATSKDNLLSAIKEENREWKKLYPSFAQTAREEGFDILAEHFEKIAAIENDHESKFREMLHTITLEQEQALAEEPKAATLPKQDNPLSPAIQYEGLSPLLNAAGPDSASATPKTLHRCLLCGNLEGGYLDTCPICGCFAAFV